MCATHTRIHLETVNCGKAERTCIQLTVVRQHQLAVSGMQCAIKRPKKPFLAACNTARHFRRNDASMQQQRTYTHTHTSNGIARLKMKSPSYVLQRLRPTKDARIFFALQLGLMPRASKFHGIFYNSLLPLFTISLFVFKFALIFAGASCPLTSSTLRKMKKE